MYLLDTNVFVEAHRRYYSRDLCPGFWDCLAHYCREPRLLSIDRVRGEIQEGDALDEWVGNAPDELFASTANAPVVEMFGNTMAWVQGNEQFTDAAKAEFAADVDGWVVAYAKAHGHVVVTHEVYNAEVRKRVPIPNVCREFNVPYLDTFEMLRALEVRFGWQRRA